MQSFIDAWMRMTGRIHVLLCRIPAFGEPLARGLSWYMAIFPWLGGVRKTETIAETIPKGATRCRMIVRQG